MVFLGLALCHKEGVLHFEELGAPEKGESWHFSLGKQNFSIWDPCKISQASHQRDFFLKKAYILGTS